MKNIRKQFDVVIVGAGFTGLSAARLLSEAGYSVGVIEQDDEPGGLAGTFRFNDKIKVEKFYHHWFNSDKYVMKLISELGMSGDVLRQPSNTGIYLNKRIWKLSSPIDLLRFKPLSLLNRIKLGLVIPKIRMVKNWRDIEHLSIREWLEPICGRIVYDTIWAPLVSAKFSVYANQVSAVWMWKKLALRGTTRSKTGKEELCYFRGGFGRLSERLVADIQQSGGSVQLGVTVEEVLTDTDKITGIKTSAGIITANQFLFTPATPLISRLFSNSEHVDWLSKLDRIKYLGNICIVLRLNKSLSSTYWLNVNDPGFPFVGVIEHTNFDKCDEYGGDHIVYLSRYLSVADPHWLYDDTQYYEMAKEYLKKMFPSYSDDWVIEYKIWRSEHAQPVTDLNYSINIPSHDTPYKNGKIATMAQIYPEDRGTNYAIRDGERIAKEIVMELEKVF